MDRFVVLLLWFVSFPAFCVFAQANTAAIDLNVVITASGTPVADLKQSDFTVYDNKAPQKMTSFRVLGSQDAPRMTVLVDAVNVPYTNLAFQREEVTKFFLANGGQLATPTELAVFTDKGVVTSDGFTTEGKELSEALNNKDIGLREIRRSSQFEMWDRLNLSLQALRGVIAQQAQLPGRKMILWISPGWPILSGPGVQLNSKQQDKIFADIVELSTIMRRAQIVLYAVSPFGAAEGVGRSLYYQNFLNPVTKPGQVALGNLSLQVLAVQSGGLALVGSNDTAGLLKECARDAQVAYQISYVPAEGEKASRFHKTEVRVSRSGLNVRTSQGYYVEQP